MYMLWWQQSASLCHDSMSRRSIQHHVTSACHLCYTWRLLSRHMNNRCTWRDDKSTALHKTFFPQLPFSLPCRLWQSRAQVHPAEDAACCWRERDFSLSQGPADIPQIATTLIQQTMHQAHRAGHIFDGVFCRCQSCITSVTAAINLQGLQRKVQPGYECTTACLIATFGVTKAASVANLSISAHTCCPILKFHAWRCCVIWPAEDTNLQGYHKHFLAFFCSPSGTCQQMTGPPAFLLSCAALCRTLHRRHSHSAVLLEAEHSESTGNPLWGPRHTNLCSSQRWHAHSFWHLLGLAHAPQF